MIIEYEEKYAEEVKDLVNIDKEKYNQITPQYREIYFAKTLDEVKNVKEKFFYMKKIIILSV